MNGIKIVPGDKKSNVSFVVAKVDNPMMTSRPVRIINGSGQTDSKGRLEVKINRSWNTISKTGAAQNEIIA